MFWQSDHTPKKILTLPSAVSDNYLQIQKNDFQRSQIKHGNHSVNIKRQGRREPAEIGDGSEVALYGIQIQILQQSHYMAFSTNLRLIDSWSSSKYKVKAMLPLSHILYK